MTGKQTERFFYGGPTTKLAMDYVRIWQDRCYDDIPDEVPYKLEKSGRAPSYKAIAMCILKNDLQLRGLGFGRQESAIVEGLYADAKANESPQMRLI